MSSIGSYRKKAREIFIQNLKYSIKKPAGTGFLYLTYIIKYYVKAFLILDRASVI